MLKVFILFLIWVSKILADVEITQPNSGQTFSVSSGTAQVKIAWDDDSSDDDDQFSLSKAKSYTISLCTGPSTSVDCFFAPLKASKLTSNSYTASLDADVADDGYYFFQIYTEFAEEASTIHYTNRFQLKGMTGSTKTLTVANTVTGDPPADQTEGGAAATINSKSFSITYTLQTGRTRYAPMQLQPGTKVTASSWSRKYPTSAVTFYSTMSPSPKCLSTITPGWSYTINSLMNYAAARPTPSVAYDASLRVTKASLSTAAKAKRWLD